MRELKQDKLSKKCLARWANENSSAVRVLKNLQEYALDGQKEAQDW